MTYIAYNPPFPSSYESLSAKDKQDFMWGKALADGGVSGKYYDTIQNAKLVTPNILGGMDFTPIGHNESDENAAGRQKLLHSVGKSAKVIINWTGKNPYTGAFAEKELIGIMRASSGTKPLVTNVAPAFAIKVFRDKVPSGNLHTMYSLYGQPNDTNFFKNNLSNHLSTLPRFGFGGDFMKLKALNAKFQAYDAHPNMTGLSDLAKFKNDGTKVDNPTTPFSLVFVPNPVLTKMCENAPLEGENFGCLKDIAEGTLLYTIWCSPWPVAKKDVKRGTLQNIGTVTSASKFISSKFMDEVVQFKHVFWDDEIKALGKNAWPSWDTIVTKEFAQEDGVQKYDELLALHAK